MLAIGLQVATSESNPCASASTIVDCSFIALPIATSESISVDVLGPPVRRIQFSLLLLYFCFWTNRTCTFLHCVSKFRL